MSITITVTNSICQLSGHKKSLDKRLKQVLSYKDQNVDFSLFKAHKELSKLEAMLDNKKISNKEKLESRYKQLEHIIEGLERKLFISLYSEGEFPTGLLPKVLECLVYSKLQYEIRDLRKKPRKQHKFILKNSLPQLRYYQKEAAKRLEGEGRGIVVMPTGTGKTVTICRMIWDLGVNTLIITPNKSITDMMVDTVKHFFGKGKVTKLNTKSKKLNKINIVNIQALVKLDPKLLEGIDAIFIDEFHHSAADTYREVNLKLSNAYYRIGVTATNFRNDGADIALESVLSNVLYEYDIKTAIDEGFLVEPDFVIIDNYVEDERTWQETYKNCIVLNESRNADVADIAEEHSKDQVLILVQHVEHGEILAEMLNTENFLHGKVNDVDRQRMMENYRKKKIKLLIGTSVIGEGVDLPCAEVLIMAGGGKAKSQIMQNVGRVLRIAPGKEKALVYDFADEGSRWLGDHADQRQEVYKQY